MMMKILYITMVAIMLTAGACHTANNSNEPHLELKTGNPYQLTISNFQWTYSKLTGSLSGDFDKLDQQVYDLLKGKEGVCEVYLINNNTYKKLLGILNIQQINDSQDWKTWKAALVIESMLKWKAREVQQPIDSARVDSIPIKFDSQPKVDSVISVQHTPEQAVDSVVQQ